MAYLLNMMMIHILNNYALNLQYASACASIQNLLLSLHSEGLACKWSTPMSLTHCQAFRALINCASDDLVAGVIMIGLSASSNESTMKRHRRRLFFGDTLRDL